MNQGTIFIGLLIFAVSDFAIYHLGTSALFIPVEYQPFVVFGIMGIPVSILLLLPNAVLGDIAEHDAIETGNHREAMIFSAQGFLMKLNLGVSGMVLAYLISAFGKDIAQPLGIKLSGPVAAVVCIVGLIAFFFYPEKDVMGVLEDHRAKRSSGG